MDADHGTALTKIDVVTHVQKQDCDILVYYCDGDVYA